MHPPAMSLSLADTDELVYRFAHCRVLIDPDGRSVTTRFEDGAEVVARPNLDQASIAQARSLGYRGSDEAVAWAMISDGHLLHTLVAEAQGHPWSATLRAMARGYKLAPGVVEQEERLVRFAQRLSNVGLDCVLPPLS
jgi:hypothetical protein